MEGLHRGVLEDERNSASLVARSAVASVAIPDALGSSGKSTDTTSYSTDRAAK